MNHELNKISSGSLRKQYSYVAIAVIFAFFLLLPSIHPFFTQKAYGGSQLLFWNSNLEQTATFGALSLIIIDSGSIDYVNNCENLHSVPGRSITPPQYSNDYIYSSADIYIVPHRDDWGGNLLRSPVPLTDVSGAPNTVSAFPFTGTIEEELIGQSSRIGNGVFDVIYDECQDGFLHGEDKIFPRAITIDIPINYDMSRSAKSFAEQAKRNHLSTAIGYKSLADVITAYYYVYKVGKIFGKLPDVGKTTEAINKEVLSNGALYSNPELSDLISKVPASWASAAVKAVIFILERQEEHYRKLAADPPNPDFSHIIDLADRQYFPMSSPTNDPLVVGLDKLANEWNNEQAIAKSLLDSLEAFQGAQIEGNARWGLIHAREIKEYSNMLSTQFSFTNDRLSDLSAIIISDDRPFDLALADLEADRKRVSSSGFNATEKKDLMSMGFSETDITHMRDILAGSDYSLKKQGLLDLFSNTIRINNNLKNNLADFSSSINDTISQIKFNLQAHYIDTMPIVVIEGPDEGLEGTSMTFNGSGSNAPNNTVSKFEWDLDGDGQFDDSSLSSPSLIYRQAFDGYIGLRVTTAGEEQSTGYKRLKISDVNHLPNIDSRSPDLSIVKVIANSSSTFSISVSDPDGDDTTEQWSVDDTFVATGDSYVYTPMTSDIGVHTITVNSTDDSPSGGAASEEWTVFVVMPDADNDTWSSNLDCNDNNPNIHPDAKEIHYNGIDDDCNPTTLDNNTAPVANNQTVAGFQNSDNTLSLLASDVDGDQLTFSIVDQPVNGTLSNITHYSGTPDVATVIYTPNQNFHGTDKFTFKVNDGKEDSNKTGTINIGTVISESPTAHEQHLSTKENTPIEIELNATNPDGHPLQFSIAGVTKIGGVTGHSVYGTVQNLTQTGPNTAKVTYIPGPNYVSEKWFGDDYFTFKVKDGQDIPGFEGRAESSAFVYITVNDTNNAPVVYNNTVSTFENTSVNITLRGQDADNDIAGSDTPYNHGLNFSIVSPPLHGNVSEIFAEVKNIKTPYNDTDHRIVYTPETGYVGSDLFTIKANDDELDSNVATVSITVKPSNQNLSKEFENGDVILGTTLRGIQWFKPDGTLVKILPSSPNSGEQFTGGAFDSQGNLYMTEFGTLALYGGNAVSKYNSTGGYVSGFGNNKTEDYGCIDGTQPHIGFNCMLPESALVDKNGTIYIGGIATNGGETLPEDDARDDIRKFDSQGNLLATFNILTEARGADWIELGPDQCTMYYTSEDIHVKRYDVCKDKQLPDFANVYGAGRPTHELGGATALPSYALRLLSDGGMLVASQSKIVRLDLSGSIIQLYDAPGEHVWFSLNLDPDGKSFWSASSGGSGSPYVYRFDIETGKVLQYIKSNGGNGVSGVVIKGELIEATKEYPPEVFDANVTTNRNTPVIVNLSGSDIANDNLTFSIVNGPANGQVDAQGIQQLTNNISQIEYTPNTNFTGVDSFTFKANDGNVDSNNTGVVNIRINSEPLARDDIASTIEGKSVNIPVLANDTSESANPVNTNDILTIQSLNTSRLIGDALINTNNNTITYTPLLTFTGTESFEYTVSDDNGATDSASVTVNIRSLNEVPIANVQSISTPEDTPLNFTLTGSDPNGDPISFSRFSGPSNGIMKILNSTTGLTEYTPLPSYHGNDTYQFRVSDGRLLSSPANISITVGDDGINDPPVAVSERVSTPFNQELSIDVLANDIDPNNDTLSISDVIFGPVYDGNTTIINNETITFKPGTNFIGSDVFFYNVTDGNGGLDTAQVIVDVTPPGTNSAPTAFNHTAKVRINTPTNITMTGSDPDQNPLRFFVVADPSEGNITSPVNPINDTAVSVEYTPAADFNGADSFNYIAFDGALQSNVASVLVNVTNTTDTQPPINNPPIASDDAVIANEDNQVNIDVLANDTDMDVGDIISVIDIADNLQPENGTAIVNANNGTITYSPFANYNGEDRFDYTISDDTANSTAIVSVTINPVNDAPVAVSSINATTSEDSPVDIVLGGTDIDNDALTFSTLSRPTSGNLSAITPINNTAANVTYTPDSQFFGSDGFTFNLNDGVVNSTNNGIVSIAVENVNHPPIADAGTDFELIENTTGILNGTASSDPDAAAAGDTIVSYSWMQTQGPPVTLQEANTATPSFTAPLVDGDTLLGFNLTVTDNNGLVSVNPASVNVTVRNVNQPILLPPIASIIPTNQTVNENTTGVTLSGVSSYDPDGGDIVSYLWSQISGPTITLNSTTSPAVQFDAPPSVTEDTLFQFNLTVTDNEGASSTNNNNSTATVVVRNVNQLPIADAGPSQTVNENSTGVTLNGTASTDPDGGSIASYNWVQTAGSPTVTLSGANTATPSFTAPSVNTDTSLAFTLTVTDNEGLSSTNNATTTVLVRNINNPPTANAGIDQTVNENATNVRLDGSGSSDADGTIASYNWRHTQGPTVSLQEASTATPSFTAPIVTTDTTITFSLTVTDNDGLNSTAADTVNILVKNVNQPPVAKATVSPSTTVEKDTIVTLDGSSSTDPDGGTIVSYKWEQTSPTSPTVTLIGSNTAQATFTAPSVTADTTFTFKLTVTDSEGSPASTTVNVLVKKPVAVNQPPIAKAAVLPSQTVAKGTLVTLDGSTSTDPDPGDSIASFRWEKTSGSPSITLSGANTAKATFTAPSVTADTTFTFKLTVTDKQGVSSSTSVNVFVQKDTQPSNKPPDTSKATPSTSTLWPPNHKMVKITIQNVNDPEKNNPVTIKITKIMQDEPVNGLGDGDTSPDGSGIGTSTAQLRSERAGNEDGRVYHIYFTATDSKGQSANGEVVVSVPHDQSGRKAIDSGPKYDSTLKSSIVDTTPPVIVGTTP